MGQDHTDTGITLEAAILVGVHLDLGQACMNVFLNKAVLLEGIVNLVKFSIERNARYVDGGIRPFIRFVLCLFVFTSCLLQRRLCVSLG